MIANEGRIFKPKNLSAIEFREEFQSEMFKLLAAHFDSMPFTDEPQTGFGYHFNNSSYNYGDACIYWAILATFRPQKILEIGCGYSSALALDAIRCMSLQTKCFFVDPFPELLLKIIGSVAPPHILIANEVQNVDTSLFGELSAGDILFIDSSHVVKTDSDVYFEISEILPRLSSGVVVHFHDAFYPFEYPLEWIKRDNRSWNELYFLQAFLMYNRKFEIIYFNDFFAKRHLDIVQKYAGPQSARISVNPGGGLWLAKT